MLGNSNRPKHLVPRLLMTLALAISLPAPGQDAADTRPYSTTNNTGLSLRLDLKLPEASRQRSALQPMAEPSDHNVPALIVDSPEQVPATRWPYYLLGLLVLGGSAAWFLRRQSIPASAPVPPLYSKSGRNEAPPKPFEFDEEPGNEEPDKAESTSLDEQSSVSIQLLRAHIEQNPGESPVPWLLLLDLLHRMGNAEEYEETRQQCKLHFNVDMPAYKKIKTVDKRQGIESYPHIMNKLMRLWPGEEASSYLNALLHDSRDGSRVGFDLATYHDIALLRSVLESASISQED